MCHRRPLYFVLLVALLLIAACAPDDLDITPTAAPTPIPMITVYVTGAVTQTGTTVEIPLGSRVQDAIEAAGGASENADLQRINLASIVRDGDQVHVPAQGEVTEEAQAAAAEATPEPEAVPAGRAGLEALLEQVPGQIEAGVISWRRDTSTAPRFVERDEMGGWTVRIAFTEAGGGLMEVTFGLFETHEQAIAFYDQTREQLSDTLARAEELDVVPTPNAFGSGTYGSDAIFTIDNVFVRVSIPRFSSTVGSSPLPPASRAIAEIVRNAIGAGE